MGICCMAQETQTGVLYQPRWGGRWEGGSKGRGYGWFMLKFNRKQRNSREMKNEHRKEYGWIPS